MAYIPGLTPRVHGQLPPSMNTRPGSNSPTTHLTDATSGGRQGYGSFVDPNYYSQVNGLVNALPSVAAARLNLQTQGNQSYDQMRQAIQNAIINFGDPKVAQAVLAKYGMALDPTTAKLAAANTSDGQGHWGNSVIGQLQQQAQTALGAQLQAIGGSGFQNTSAYGTATNLSNIGLGHDVYGAGQKLLGDLSGSINSNQETQNKLTGAYQNALLNAPNIIKQNPSLYPMPTPTVNTVGGGQPTATPTYVNPASTFTAAPRGAGAFPTRTGALPLPPLPKPSVAAPVGGMGHQT